MDGCVLCGGARAHQCQLCGGPACAEHTKFYRGQAYCSRCWRELCRLGIVSWTAPYGAGSELEESEPVAVT